MMRGLFTRLKYDTFVVLLLMSGGLSGCNVWFNASSPHDHTLHYSQKEKISTLPDSQAKKTDHCIPTESFWDSLKKDFKLNHHTNHATVQAQIHYFLKRPYQLSKTIEYAAPYIHYVYEQVKKRHLPSELVLLPLVESTYNLSAINATSRASGLWQLTPGTAKAFGVRQDSVFDGKRDLYTSTQAALDYLTYLNQLFSRDWLLTLAAYDAGEGNIKRAIHYNAIRNRKTHFWDLPLVLETVSYAPKLLALSAIIKNPKKYGLKLPAINRAPYLEQVDVIAGVSIFHAAALANISIKELVQLNPGFRQPFLIPSQPYRLLLPTACSTTFKSNLLQASLHPSRLRLAYYKIKAGDTLSNIAKRHHVTAEQLRLWNGLKRGQVLPVNKILVAIKMPFHS